MKLCFMSCTFRWIIFQTSKLNSLSSTTSRRSSWPSMISLSYPINCTRFYILVGAINIHHLLGACTILTDFPQLAPSNISNVNISKTVRARAKNTLYCFYRFWMLRYCKCYQAVPADLLPLIRHTPSSCSFQM